MTTRPGYRGRRCVVTGAATPVGAALTRALVAHDAEVHAVDSAPIAATGVASCTEADVADAAAAGAAAARIGAVVDCLFDCAALALGEPSAFVAASAGTRAAHSVVVVVVATDAVARAETATAGSGVRVVVVPPDDATDASVDRVLEAGRTHPQQRDATQ